MEVGQKITRWIPYAVAVLLVLIDMVTPLTSTGYIDEFGNNISYGVISAVQYGAIGLAVVGAVAFIFRKNYWVYAFLVLILASFSPYVAFTNVSFYMGINTLVVDMIGLTFLIMHIALNGDCFKIPSNKEKSAGNARKSEKTEKHFNRMVEDFQRRFQAKSTEELEAIIAGQTLVPEAIAAAKKLLNQRANQATGESPK